MGVGDSELARDHPAKHRGLEDAHDRAERRGGVAARQPQREIRGTNGRVDLAASPVEIPVWIRELNPKLEDAALSLHEGSQHRNHKVLDEWRVEHGPTAPAPAAGQ